MTISSTAVHLHFSFKMGIAGFVLRLYGFELDQDNTCVKDHALLCSVSTLVEQT
jgi:hypothetical protein